MPIVVPGYGTVDTFLIILWNIESNIRDASAYHQYNVSLPKWLRNRSRQFVAYCQKRLSSKKIIEKTAINCKGHSEFIRELKQATFFSTRTEISFVVIDGEWWRQPFSFEIMNVNLQLTSGCRPCWQKRRLLKLSIVSQRNIKTSYSVKFSDFGNVPSCSCFDWQKHHWPCKHFLATKNTFLKGNGE